MADITRRLGLMFFSLVLILRSAQQIHAANGSQTPSSLDHLIQIRAFDSFRRHPKTAVVYRVVLPGNLSGVEADTVRYRSGSLRRYGAELKELVLLPGITVTPYAVRIILVKQNLGNWSSIHYNIPGFQLVSPVLGLLTYDASDLNATNPAQLEIQATKNPITINFSVLRISPNPKALCARIDLNGRVNLQNQTSANVCSTLRQGHFGLVIESPRLAPPPPIKNSNKASKWKVAVGSSVGGILAAILLGFLCVALVKLKKRSRIAEMERRAYEDEALQMSMVGHVRAPTASVTRTLPTLENDYVAQGFS